MWLNSLVSHTIPISPHFDWDTIGAHRLAPFHTL
uniref:Uncharacterized protein n=1 Tax=Arundo donax TaxID=35708 RepID=A0A0A9GM61_ARUDO